MHACSNLDFFKVLLVQYSLLSFVSHPFWRSCEKHGGVYTKFRYSMMIKTGSKAKVNRVEKTE